MLTSLPSASPDAQVVIGRALKAPADSGDTGSSTGGGAQECDSSSMLDALNALRAEHGASPLSWSADLAQQALDVVAKQADNPSCQFQASGLGWDAGAGAGGRGAMHSGAPSLTCTQRTLWPSLRTSSRSCHTPLPPALPAVCPDVPRRVSGQVDQPGLPGGCGSVEGGECWQQRVLGARQHQVHPVGRSARSARSSLMEVSGTLAALVLSGSLPPPSTPPWQEESKYVASGGGSYVPEAASFTQVGGH